MSRLEWLTSLENGKRTVAILIIGITVLFGLYTKSEYNRGVEKERYEKHEAQYKETLIKRTDEFNAEYRKFIIECNARIESGLRDQLDDQKITIIKSNKTLRQNEKIIKFNKNLIK